MEHLRKYTNIVPHGGIKIRMSFIRRLIFFAFCIGGIRVLFSLVLNRQIASFSNDSLSQGETPKIFNDKKCSSVVPCTIWMFFEKGWNNAPPMQTLCLNSMQFQNPNYFIMALDLPKAEVYINRTQLYSDEAWKTAGIQAKLDIIRVELLARYGGIWADATVFCSEPLDLWLDKALRPEEFVVYERHDRAVEEDKEPWISSWFIASTTTSKFLAMLVDEVRNEWSDKPYTPTVFGYFWIHRLFARLIQKNAGLRGHFHKVLPMDAGGPHCLNKSAPVSHVYKLEVVDSL